MGLSSSLDHIYYSSQCVPFQWWSVLYSIPFSFFLVTLLLSPGQMCAFVLFLYWLLKIDVTKFGLISLPRVRWILVLPYCVKRMSMALLPIRQSNLILSWMMVLFNIVKYRAMSLNSFKAISNPLRKSSATLHDLTFHPNVAFICTQKFRLHHSEIFLDSDE